MPEESEGAEPVTQAALPFCPITNPCCRAKAEGTLVEYRCSYPSSSSLNKHVLVYGPTFTEAYATGRTLWTWDCRKWSESDLDASVGPRIDSSYRWFMCKIGGAPLSSVYTIGPSSRVATW